MRQLTIAQRREAQLKRFNDEYIHDIEKAKKILNSYYRYVALVSRVGELENDSRYAYTRYCKSEQEKEARHYDRLTGYLKPYGISIFVPWSLPYLGIKEETSGAIKTNVIEPILY